MLKQVSALIADDEPLLRDALVRLLKEEWPELKVVAQARNGREAVEYYFQTKPDICFLDVHMPGINGIEAARTIGRETQLVFITAFTDYAVQAFNHGALDYLVKPLERERLRDTVQRLQDRLGQHSDPARFEEVLHRLEQGLQIRPQRERLRWIKALVGQALKMVEVDRIDYFRSDDKYTLISWRDDHAKINEALIRSPLRELLEQLDPEEFVQIHRSVVVNLRRINQVVRGDNDTATVYLKDRSETLPVSRSFLHHFKQM